MKRGTCPKCGGDLFPEADIYGTSLNCLQCGWNGELIKVPVLAHVHGLSTREGTHYSKVRREINAS